MDYIEEVMNILNIYNFNDNDKDIFWNIIKPIFYHPEFQRRCNNAEYPHHGSLSLGSHILRVAAVTYQLCKKEGEKNKYIDSNLAVKIAMMHDLYELPWQNNKIKKRMLTNKHGFTHPIEATINAINWFPEYFKNTFEASIIIDGIIHHMYPFPVRIVEDDLKKIELNNHNKLKNINKDLLAIIKHSTERYKFKHMSFNKSLFNEGKIVSNADKLVTFKKDLNNLSSIIALITGRNNNI